jgi:anionic cell wall polymer biosynthesis LytR-Cps2A-Psr (LCP) family protein
MRNRLIAAGAAAVVVLGGTLTYLWATGSPLLSTASPATRNTLLLQVLDNDNDAVADAILVADKSTGTNGSAADSTGHGAAVLVPSQMVVNTISTGNQPFGGDMTGNPMVAPAGADTVASSLGVQVDGVWGLPESTFAVLIDSFGGVQLTTDIAVPAVTAVATPTPSSTNPSTTTPSSSIPGATSTSPAVAKGSGKLDGAQAMAYALYRGPGEPISAQVDRFGQVLSALLEEMPTTAELVTAYLNQLGVVYDPSLPESKVATILAQMAAEQQAGNFTIKALPLQDNSTDQLDFIAAGPIISSLLGGTVQSGLASGGTARVLVEDATGESGGEATLIESAAQAKLINGGYSYVGSDIVAKRAKSVIEIPTGADQSAAEQVADTLGLPTADIQVMPGMSQISDITAIVGADWVQIGMNG